jgi:RepB DNA-primase from phage plasmid/Family of unknown function (DUF5906)
MNAHTYADSGATAIPSPDYGAIQSHVEMLHTLAKSAGVDGVLAFTRIDDKNKTHTEKFAIGDVERMTDAICGWSTHPSLNIYMSHAIFRKDLPSWSTGKEEDVLAVLSLVGDLDSDLGKKAARLDRLPLPATYVVETSAGNFHATFPLGRALPPSDAKAIAVALSNAIGGDSGTKDISHLWRIPGTLNWPTKTKLARNRPATPQLVTVKLAWNGDTIEPEALWEAVKDFAAATGSSSTGSGDTTGGASETFADLPADLKKLAAAPPYPGEDQSTTAASVAWKLFRRGWSNNAVQSLFEEYSNGIGKRYADGKTDLRKEVERLRQKFEEQAAGDDVERLNKTHAILPIGGKVRVVKFGELPAFPGRETIVMTQTIEDFKALQNKYRHQYRDERTGEQKHVPMGTHWVNNPKRRQYDDGMAFMPHHDGDVGTKLNLWRGFGVKAIKPAPGSRGEAGRDKFLAFMRDIICSGNQEHFDYLVKREATIFQKRIRSEVALGLQTKEEGCGKGFYEYVMRHLLGKQHAMQATNPEHIIGKFNPHLETLLRLTADEALFVGNHKHRNSLFSLVTEADLTIEPKNCGVYQADSFLNISITSNSDHFLPVSDTARRFFIPTVSTARMQDHAYFNDLKADLEAFGYAALLHHFLYEVDLTGFNVRKVPQTEGLREQRDYSLEPLDVWWVELLETGVITGSDPLHPCSAVSNAYQREIKVDTSYMGETSTQVRLVTQLGIFDQARQIEPKLRNVSVHALGAYLTAKGCHRARVMRHRGWTFPSLSQCREDWVKRFSGWTWQNTKITAWCPEEGEDVTAKDAIPRVMRDGRWATPFREPESLCPFPLSSLCPFESLQLKFHQ